MPKARKSQLSKVTFAHELVEAVGDVGAAAASTSPSTSSRGPTIQEASLALLSTHVKQQVQDAVKVLDEADFDEYKAMTACDTELDAYDVAERVFHASLRRWNRAFDRKPPPDPDDQIEKFHKIQVKMLRAEVKMKQSVAAAFSAGCDARDAANKAQSIELHALRRLLVHDNNINSHKRKKVA